MAFIHHFTGCKWKNNNGMPAEKYILYRKMHNWLVLPFCHLDCLCPNLMVMTLSMLCILWPVCLFSLSAIIILLKALFQPLPSLLRIHSGFLISHIHPTSSKQLSTIWNLLLLGMYLCRYRPLSATKLRQFRPFQLKSMILRLLLLLLI
jgi:hypothetical protein